VGARAHEERNAHRAESQFKVLHRYGVLVLHLILGLGYICPCQCHSGVLHGVMGIKLRNITTIPVPF
jgi:hypothetical protein